MQVKSQPEDSQPAQPVRQSSGADARDGTATDRSGVSVIVTVWNDMEGLGELLLALAAQTTMPDEIVVVDGGSADGTLDLLHEWRPEGTTVRIIEAPGTNIAAGRNVAVRTARNDWIVSTDAGCRPVPGWLEAFQEVRGKAPLAAGIWLVDAESPFERAAAYAHYPFVDELHSDSRLVRLSHRLFGREYRAGEAGGRCMAFSRATWEAVGGFPEHVYAGEDHAFSAAAVALGFQPVLVEGAVVRWRTRETWRDMGRMFRTYARGDVRTRGRLRHAVRAAVWAAAPILTVRGRPAVRLLMLGSAASYMWLPLRRAWRSNLPVWHWWQIPILVAAKDLSQIVGSVEGVVDAIRDVPQPLPTPSTK